MMLGAIAAGVCRPAIGGALWTPLNMASVPQLYLDAHDSVVTNVSGLASAISNLGAMGAGGDFSQAVADRRPAIVTGELNGKRILRLDGANDWLECNTAAMKDIFKAQSAAWSFVVYKKRESDASPTTKVLTHFIGDTGAPRFTHWCGSATAGKANTPYVSYNVSGFTSLQGNTVAVGAYALSLADLNLSSGSVSLYLNGSLDASATAPTGSFSNTSGNGGAFPVAAIGSRGDGVWMPDVDLAVCLAGNVPLPIADRQKLEGWAAHKYGLTANLPSGHPYKTVAPTA